jgi:hypothetical protein
MKKIDPKLVLLAYDSYLLAEKVKERMIMEDAGEKELLDILQILLTSYPKRGGFRNEEIAQVSECLFRNCLNFFEVNSILQKAKQNGKVTWTGHGWKLAPSAKEEESSIC